MERPGQDYELDELGTLKQMMQLYRAYVDRLEKDERIRYISREEYVHVTRSMIHCLDASVHQLERMLGCLERVVDSVSQLSEEVIELKGRMDAGEQEEF